MSDHRHASIGIHGLQEHAAPQRVHRLRLYTRAKWVALLLIVALLLGAAVVVAMRMANGQALAAAAKEQSRLYVTVISPKPRTASPTLTLAGTLQGVTEAPIYARTTGYVEKWFKDIGEPVKQGDILAQIAAPEVAQQLLEARAAQDQAATNAQLAKSSLVRWEALRVNNAVSQQEVDERRNVAALATAAQAATAASVQRLQNQVGYSRIVAPFSGVVTKRNIDIGTLVDAGSGSKVLFTVTKVDPLRVYVYVPQAYAPQIQVGASTEVRLKELSGKVFSGKIVRTAGAIDPVTRTLQVEISLPNADGKLMSGAYAQVGIKGIADSVNALTVPNNTLLFRPEGPRLAVVDDKGTVRLQAITISRELGAEVELADGIGAKDRVILNPPDSIMAGDVVHVVEPTAKKSNAKPGS